MESFGALCSYDLPLPQEKSLSHCSRAGLKDNILFPMEWHHCFMRKMLNRGHRIWSSELSLPSIKPLPSEEDGAGHLGPQDFQPNMPGVELPSYMWGLRGGMGLLIIWSLASTTWNGNDEKCWKYSGLLPGGCWGGSPVFLATPTRSSHHTELQGKREGADTTQVPETSHFFAKMWWIFLNEFFLIYSLTLGQFSETMHLFFFFLPVMNILLGNWVLRTCHVATLEIVSFGKCRVD